MMFIYKEDKVMCKVKKVAKVIVDFTVEGLYYFWPIIGLFVLQVILCHW
jgi:hypothetical protein